MLLLRFFFFFTFCFKCLFLIFWHIFFNYLHNSSSNSSPQISISRTTARKPLKRNIENIMLAASAVVHRHVASSSLRRVLVAVSPHAPSKQPQDFQRRHRHHHHDAGSSCSTVALGPRWGQEANLVGAAGFYSSSGKLVRLTKRLTSTGRLIVSR